MAYCEQDRSNIPDGVGGGGFRDGTPQYACGPRIRQRVERKEFRG